uniref:O-acyltransferase like n=1 Tax=Neogobius melanostomus TaxID=47308 RepID=A0A8C6TB82_9GOBI
MKVTLVVSLVLLCSREGLGTAKTVTISQRCLMDTNSFLSELKRDHPKEYAVHMYDAFGKMGSNVKGGNTDQPGLLQECRSAQAPSFSGQYCQVFLQQGSMEYFCGICVPDSCKEEMSNGWYMFQLEGLHALSYCLQWYISLCVLTISGQYCFSTDSFPLGTVSNCIEAFSLQTTTRGVLSTSSITGGGYSSLHGIRVLSLLWIICGHSAQYPIITSIDNYKNWKKTFETSPLYVFSLSGPVFLAVDTFLLLGIQPLHIFIMCLTMSLIPVSYWWANLLLVSNLLPCVPWTWYLSLDFQCYTTTPILFSIDRTMALASISHNNNVRKQSTRTYRYLYMKTYIFTLLFRTSENYVFYYLRPHTRYGPYLIGIVTGIYLTTKNAVVGWLCCFGVMALLVGLAYVLRDAPSSPSVPHALYQGLHRPLWALAVTWIILACEGGYGGEKHMTFLSSRFWRPFSNISFACYLTHPVFILIYIGVQETPIHYSDINFSIHPFSSTLFVARSQRKRGWMIVHHITVCHIMK